MRSSASSWKPNRGREIKDDVKATQKPPDILVIGRDAGIPQMRPECVHKAPHVVIRRTFRSMRAANVAASPI